MIKLGTKMSGPLGIGLKFALLNLAAILSVFIFGEIFEGGSSVDFLFEGLFFALTFPANLFNYTFTPQIGGVSVNFWCLNPLIWGAVAYVIRAAAISDQIATTMQQEEKFNGPPCVSCNAPTNPNSETCPECGWTQPR